MSALESRAQVVKLAHLLGTEPEALPGLEEAPPDDLRALRALVAESLFASQRGAFQRAAALAGILPAALAAKLAERVLGPLLSARSAGLLEHGKATEMLEHLSPGFLAEVAVALEPSQASGVIGLVPIDLVTEVAVHLDRRDEHVTMAGFVDQFDEDTLTAAMAALSDEGLLHTGFVVEDKSRLDGIVGHLSDRRVQRIIEVVARKALWEEALDLTDRLGDEQRARLAAQVGDLPDEAIDGLLAALAADPTLRPSARRLADAIPDGQRDRILARGDALGLDTADLAELREALGA